MTLTSHKSSDESFKITPEKKKKLHVFIAGIGAVGGTLAQLIEKLDHPLFELNIIGICNSSHTVWNPKIDADSEAIKIKEGEPTDWDQIPEKLIQIADKNVIFVDATGTEKVARSYHYLLSNGVHIATPSKRANTFEQSYFNQLIEITDAGIAQYRYETAVGAGLPVISTINTLLDSGDNITKITGVASGTMTFLFTKLQNGVSFSEVVQKAKEDGYSEPDPRDDLSGEDVARKFLILARTCGFTFERDELEVENLVPKELNDLSTEDFLARLPEFDGHWKSRNAKALVNNRKLRYVGSFTPEGIRVGVQEVNANSPLGGLAGTDNIFQIYTERYSTSPIVVQGPGAGREVTAAGVLGDIIDIGKAL